MEINQIGNGAAKKNHDVRIRDTFPQLSKQYMVADAVLVGVNVGFKHECIIREMVDYLADGALQATFSSQTEALFARRGHQEISKNLSHGSQHQGVTC